MTAFTTALRSFPGSPQSAHALGLQGKLTPAGIAHLQAKCVPRRPAEAPVHLPKTLRDSDCAQVLLHSWRRRFGVPKSAAQFQGPAWQQLIFAGPAHHAELFCSRICQPLGPRLSDKGAASFIRH